MFLELNDNEKNLISCGRLIEAIKALRTRACCSLLEAKTVCDDWRNRCGPFIWKVTFASPGGNVILTVRAASYTDAVIAATRALEVRSVVRES